MADKCRPLHHALPFLRTLNVSTRDFGGLSHMKQNRLAARRALVPLSRVTYFFGKFERHQSVFVD